MKKRVQIVLTVVLALVLAASLALLARSELENRRLAQAYADAQALISAPEPDPSPTPEPEPEPTPEPEPEPEPEPTPEPDPWARALAGTDLDVLRQLSPDVIGWIQIPETELSYPLMYSGDNAYYLNHTWMGEPNSGGAIFLEENCAPDFSDFNIIVYGHRMTNTTMFGTLRLYGEEEFWRTHPRVYLVDDAWVYCFDIFSVYEANVRDLTYRLRITEEEDKQAYIDYCAGRADYETGVTPTVEDPVLTMSTCVGLGQSDYRLVVQSVLTEKYPVSDRQTD